MFIVLWSLSHVFYHWLYLLPHSLQWDTYVLKCLYFIIGEKREGGKAWAGSGLDSTALPHLWFCLYPPSSSISKFNHTNYLNLLILLKTIFPYPFLHSYVILAVHGICAAHLYNTFLTLEYAQHICIACSWLWSYLLDFSLDFFGCFRAFLWVFWTLVIRFVL